MPDGVERVCNHPPQEKTHPTELADEAGTDLNRSPEPAETKHSVHTFTAEGGNGKQSEPN